MTNKNENHSYRYSLIKLLLKCKKSTPRSKYYFLFFIFLKFIGPLILTHIIISTDSDSSVSVSKILRYLTYFNKLDASGISIINYDFLCFIIYIFVLLPPFIIFIIIQRLRHSHSKFEKKLKMSEKTFLKVGSIVITLVMLLSQHLIEILSFVYLKIYVSSTDPLNVRKEVITGFYTFQNSLLLSPYFYCFLNGIFIVVINILLYYYIILMNEPLFSSHSPVKFILNKRSLISLIILFNLQAVHYWDLVIEGAARELILIAFIIICCVLVCYYLLTCCKFIFMNAINVPVIFLSFLCLISGIFSIVRFYTFVGMTFKNTEFVTEVMAIIISLIFCYGFLLLLKKCNFKDILAGIFKKNKKMKECSLYGLISQLHDAIFNSDNFTEIFQVITMHSIKCAKTECPCKEFQIENYYQGFNELRRVSILQEYYLVKKFRSLFLNLILLLEAEISESVHQCFKNNNLLENYHILLLHVDYNYYFKSNTELGMYLINGYRKIKDMPFIFYFSLYNMEYQIIKFEKVSPLDYKKSISSYEKFFKYHQMLEYIKGVLIKNVENFEQIVQFKKEFKSSLESKKLDEGVEFKVSKDFQIEGLLNECLSLQKNDKKLSNIFDKNYSEYSLKNAELCFLIYNFYKITYKEVPLELENTFLTIESYLILQTLETSFEEVDMRHPMIIHLDHTKFKICYISQKLSDRLGYKSCEILKKDLHDLIPNFLEEEHKMLMKKFIILENNHYLSKESFILTKDKIYFPVKIHMAVIPTYKHNTLIIDFRPIDKSSEKNSCNAFLDHKFNLIAYDRNFEQNFFLTYEMFERLKISFLNLYAIREDSMRAMFKAPLENIKQYDLTDLDKSTKLYNGLEYAQNVKIMNISATPVQNNFPKSHSKKLLRKKEAIIPYLNKIETQIQETESDKDWLSRVQNLQKRVNKNSILYKMFENGNKNSWDYSSIDNFIIKLKLKNIAYIPYYFVNIIDTNYFINNNYEDQTITSTYLTINNLPVENNLMIADNRDLDNNLPVSLFGRQENEIIRINGRNDIAGLLLSNNLNASHNASINVNSSLSAESSSFNLLVARNQRNYHSLILKQQQQEEFSDSQSVFSMIDSKTGVKIRRYRTKHKKEEGKQKKENCLFAFLFICLISLVVLAIYNIFYTTGILNTSLNIFKIHYYTMLLKSTMLSTTSLILSTCFKTAGLHPLTVDTFTLTETDYQIKLSFRALELFNNEYQLKNYLAICKDIEGVDKISELLYTPEVYNLITYKWRHFTRNSTLMDELDYYHYYFSLLQFPGNWNNVCNIQNLGSLKIDQSNNSTASFGEITTYYAIFNVYAKMRDNFVTLNDLTISLIEKVHDDSQFKLMVYNFVILFIYLFLALFIFMSILIYKGKIVDSFNELLKHKSGDDFFEKKLTNFKKVLLCLDLKNGNNFETEKLRIAKERSEEINSPQDADTIREKKDKKFNNKGSTEMTAPQMETIKNSFKVKLISSSIWLIILAMILFMTIIAANVALNYQNFNDILLANHMIINFLGRIPQLTNLFLYYQISMIMNDPNFITTPQSEYAVKSKKNNYFNIEIDLKSDSFYSNLGDSEFAYIYYMYQIQTKTTKIFMDGSNERVLPTIRKIENILNSDQLCTSVGEYFLPSYNLTPLKAKNLYDNFKLMSQYAYDCRAVGKGVNLNGLSSALEYEVALLSNLYLDYVSSKSKNNTLFLTDMNLVRIILNSEYTLKKIINIYMLFSLQDINNFFNSVLTNEVVFSTVKLVWVFTFIFYFVFFVLLKLQSYNFYLTLTIKRFKKANTLDKKSLASVSQ